MDKNNHVVVMAGGVGSRFWPLSDMDAPKQFLDILGTGRSLLQMTVARFKDEICPVENIWIVTSDKFLPVVQQQLPEIPRQNILLEPCRRNTAPCIAYVSWAIKSLNSNANVVVAPSDHFIENIPKFREAINACLKFTSETDSIVTLGLRPNYPSTGYGYIEADLSYPSPTNPNIYRVDSFKEKPALEIAQRYVRENHFFWNSGIFVWNINTIVNAFRVYQPEMANIFEEVAPYFRTEKEQEIINEKFPKCENISVDYAIMEKTEEIYVYPSDFGWSDLESYNSLQSLLSHDSHGNACVGNNIKLYDTDNCIIHTAENKEVVVQGLDGFIVSEHDGKLLICKLTEEDRIKLFHS